MTPQDFVYWLNGYIELGGKAPDEAQWKMIVEHLKLTMTKVTPPLAQPKTVDEDWVKKAIEAINGRIDGKADKQINPYHPYPFQPQLNPGTGLDWTYDPNKVVITC